MAQAGAAADLVKGRSFKALEVFSTDFTDSEVETVVEDRLVYYNEARRHSSLDYKRPMEVLLSTLKGGHIAEES